MKGMNSSWNAGERCLEKGGRWIARMDGGARGQETQWATDHRQLHREELGKRKGTPLSSFSIRASYCQMETKRKNESQPTEVACTSQISGSQNRLEKGGNGSKRAVGRYPEESIYAHIIGRISGNSKQYFHYIKQYSFTWPHLCNYWLYIVLAKWQCDPLKTPSFSPSDSGQACGTRMEDVVSMGRKPGLDWSGWSGHRRWMGPVGLKWTDWEGSWGLGVWQVWWDQGWRGVWGEEAEGIWSQWVWSWGGCWDLAGSLCG